AIRLQKPVNVGGLDIHARARERQEHDLLALQGFGDLELHHHLAAAAGQRLVQLRDALSLSDALGLGRRGDTLLLLVIGVGLDLGLAKPSVGLGYHLVNLALGIFQLLQILLFGRFGRGLVLLGHLIGHLLVFDRPLIRRIEAVVFGGDPLDDYAVGVEHFIERRLGPLGLLVALVGD